MSNSSIGIPQNEKNGLVTEKTAQSTVTCLYQAHIAGYWRNVTILWSKNLMNYSLCVSVESIESDQVSSCKIDLKAWQFWGKKGCKSFDVDGNHLDVYWDLRSAKFSGCPEPCSDFYVGLVFEEEVVLLLGDNEKRAYKRMKSKPALIDAILFYKKEHVSGKKSFSTRAKFDQTKREHDIVVESSITGLREPEMWISVDGIVLIHIKNLQWKFRGNQTMLVDKKPVQVFWDVHAWLFCPPGLNHGLFIFKPIVSEADDDVENDVQVEESECSGPSKYYSVISNSSASQFCLFLYAWKIE